MLTYAAGCRYAAGEVLVWHLNAFIAASLPSPPPPGLTAAMPAAGGARMLTYAGCLHEWAAEEGVLRMLTYADVC